MTPGPNKYFGGLFPLFSLFVIHLWPCHSGLGADLGLRYLGENRVVFILLAAEGHRLQCQPKGDRFSQKGSDYCPFPWAQM